MIIRKLRLQRAWSQEHLAHVSGLSIRTIQRIERGQKASLESLKALSAVFDMQLNQLAIELDTSQKLPPQQETDMQHEAQISSQEQAVIEHVKDIKGFYTHLIQYLVVITGLFILNYISNPNYIWAWWVVLGWGIGIIAHGMSVFEIFSPFGAKWEKKQVEKRLGRKL